MNKGELINLTPFTLHIIIEGGPVRIPPSGKVATCERFGAAVNEVNGIHVAREWFGNERISDGSPFPPKKEGIYYIVCKAVAECLLGREDIFYPYIPIVKEQGEIIACKGLRAI